MPTRVDFYVISDGGPGARERTACRLVEKAWQQRHRIYIHTSSAGDSARVDQLLWTFRQGSFVPHEFGGDAADPATPVLIGHDRCPPAMTDVLVNLTDQVPAFFSRFERVAELIEPRDDSRSSGRQRWRTYQEHGCEIQSHNV